MKAAHALLATITLLLVLYADEQGLEWLRGRVETLPHKRIEWLHVFVGLGIAGLILTGGLLFINRSAYLLTKTVFLVKMGFVAALVINGFFIHTIAQLSTEKPFALLSSAERNKVFLAGGVSLVGWAGALICGLLL